jgi:two-component system nitrogen regulation sensor histidine kinase NtrY
MIGDYDRRRQLSRITCKGSPEAFLTPPTSWRCFWSPISVPVMALLVASRAENRKGQGGRSPMVRTPAGCTFVWSSLFSVIASVPTLLVVIFASLLFQYGCVEFWFSDRARTVLDSSPIAVAQAYVEENKTAHRCGRPRHGR